jgi:hypothetical protein
MAPVAGRARPHDSTWRSNACSGLGRELIAPRLHQSEGARERGAVDENDWRRASPWAPQSTEVGIWQRPRSLNYRLCHAKTPSARFRNRGFVRWRGRSPVILTTHARFTERCCTLVCDGGRVGCTSLSLRYRSVRGPPPKVAPVPGCALSNRHTVHERCTAHIGGG